MESVDFMENKSMESKENARENMVNMLIYRSWHRGCKETDILLGEFAKSAISGLLEAELLVYRDLVEENDWDIYEWILNTEAIFDAKYEPLIKKIRNFNSKNL